MAKANVPEFGEFQSAVDSFTEFTKTLREALKNTATTGDADKAELVRKVVVRLNEKSNVLVSKVFDPFVDFVHSTNGEDFMPNLTRVHNPRGRKAGEKVEVDLLD